MTDHRLFTRPDPDDSVRDLPSDILVARFFVEFGMYNEREVVYSRIVEYQPTATGFMRAALHALNGWTETEPLLVGVTAEHPGNFSIFADTTSKQFVNGRPPRVVYEPVIINRATGSWLPGDAMDLMEPSIEVFADIGFLGAKLS